MFLVEFYQTHIGCLEMEGAICHNEYKDLGGKFVNWGWKE